MTGAISTPRYSAEDFETASVRSAAPSYVSEAPSYHSTAHHGETIPAYAPRARPARTPASAPAPRRQTIGLPPVPSMPQVNIPNLHNFRVPMWSANNALASRQYHSVAARRVSDGRYGADRYGTDSNKDTATSSSVRRNTNPDRVPEHEETRPLEDPYLVGEEAAKLARRERLARETGEDILIQEDKHWDWLLVQMKTWEERERSWSRFHREVDSGSRNKALRRFGGRML